MQSIMNLKIKFRESFRPFAPCVLREDVADYFEMRPNEDSPYMLLVAALREDKRPKSAEEAELTDQEQRILELIAGGLSNKQIGKELEIAEGTVKVHVKHILRKLGLRSRVEAAVWAVEHLPKGKSG